MQVPVRAPPAHGSHLLAFGAGRTPDAGLTRQPWETSHARGAWVPGAACVPLVKRGDKAGTGQGGTQHSPSPTAQGGWSQPPLPPPAPPEPPPQPLSPSVPSGQHHRVCPGETEERVRPEHPPKRAHANAVGHSPLCLGGRPGPSPPAVQARPAPSLPLRGPVVREGTAHTTRPAEGTTRSECGFRGRSTAGGARSPRCSPHLRAVPCNELHGSQLGRFQGWGKEWGPRGVPIAGLTFSPLSPCTPGSPLSPGSPCTEKPRQR